MEVTLKNSCFGIFVHIFAAHQGWGCLRCGLRLYPKNLIRLVPAKGNLMHIIVYQHIASLPPPFYQPNGGNMFKQILFLLFLFIITSTAVSAQTVTGIVVDAQSNEALVGASVRQTGTTNGSSTDRQGRFNFTLTNGVKELTVSFVGYRTQRIDVSNNATDLRIRLVSEANLVGEVVVLGTRAGEKDPITQTTVSREEIERSYTGQDPSVVLERLTPSIISFSDAGADIGNYVQFRLRGIDQTRINTTLNGVPLNDMIDQGVFFSNFSDFSNSAQSIQVQRGVGASTNGTASYAGSVNFESINLNNIEPEFGLQLTAGSFDTYRASGEVNTGKLDNDLAFYSRFTRTLSNGFKDNSGSDSYSFFFSGGYLGAKDIVKVTAFAGKTQNDQSYLPVLLADIRNNPRTNNNDPNDTDDFEQELIQVQYSRQVNPDLTFNSTLYYGGSRGEFPFGLAPTNQLVFGLQNDHYGFLADVDYQKNNLNFKAGTHGYIFRRENINYTSPNISNPDYQDETHKDEISVFTKANVEFGKFNVFGDLQLRYVDLQFLSDQILSFGGPVPTFEVNSSRNWLFLNPKVGVNYTFDDISSAYASFGRTGREPTRTDILQGDGSSINEFNFTSALDDDIVRAEYVNDFEIGYRYNNGRLAFTANAFFLEFKNEISLVGALAANSFVPLRQNIPDSYRRGVELIGNVQITDQWEASLNATYMKTNVDRFVNGTGQVFTDVEHIFAPELILNPGIRFTPSNVISVALNGRYVSESFIELANAPGFELPEFFVLNGQFDINFSSAVSFSFLFNNIFDELYFTEGAVVDADFDGVVDGPGFRIQPPRNFYAQMKFKF